MDVLGFGGLLALASAHFGGLDAGARYAKWGLPALAAGLIPFYLRKTGEADTLVLTVKHTLLAGFYSLLLLAVVGSARGTVTNRIFTSPMLRSFGKYSYGLYVYHGLLMGLLLGWFPLSETADIRSFVLTAAVRLIAAVSICFAVSWLSWHLYENPFLKLKRYFSYRR